MYVHTSSVLNTYSLQLMYFIRMMLINDVDNITVLIFEYCVDTVIFIYCTVLYCTVHTYIHVTCSVSNTCTDIKQKNTIVL